MNMEMLKAECAKCEKCSLSKSRTNLVFGAGNTSAKLMFIGEAPGEKEDLSGVPFVGAAGKLFDRFLEAVDIKRDDLYIANILKCRPPKNRDPLPEEKEMCINWLLSQIELINPKLIVCLGRISAMRLIKPDFKITSEHGIWFDYNGRKISAVYHPSALLRDPRKKEDMMRDMIAIKAIYDKLN